MTGPVARGRHRGVGLVEWLVALSIGLIAVLAVVQTFSNADLLRRTAGTRVDGLPAGLVALDRIERELAQAGGALLATGDPVPLPAEAEPGARAGELAIGCTATVAGRPLRIAPLSASGGGGPLSSDSLTVVGGGSPFVPAPVRVDPGPVQAGATRLTLASTWGMRTGDWLLVYEQDVARAAVSGQARDVPCTLVRVAALPDAPATTRASVRLDRPVAARLSGASVIDLGESPTLLRLAVDGERRLMAEDLLEPGRPARVLAEQVLAMKVSLGIDVGGDGVVDEWLAPPVDPSGLRNPPNPLPPRRPSVQPVPAAPRSLEQVRALRIGLLVEAGSHERGTAADCPADARVEVLPPVPGDPGAGVPAMPGSGAAERSGDDRCVRAQQVATVATVHGRWVDRR